VDDDATVVADPAEMEMTARATMFVDSAIFVLRDDERFGS
jgi:hypothetical protein